MPIFHRPESRFYWYCFAVEGRRYRGSTKVTNKTTAEMISGRKFLEVLEGHAPLPRKAPRLEEFSERFLSWVERSNLQDKTDPINSLFDAVSPQPLYSFAAGVHHVFSQNLVNYFNPAFSWYESLFGPSDFQKTLSAFPNRVARERRECAVHYGWRARQHLGTRQASLSFSLTTTSLGATAPMN
jgi:hypothetical protein